jgi:hypothetical protein
MPYVPVLELVAGKSGKQLCRVTAGGTVRGLFVLDMGSCLLDMRLFHFVTGLFHFVVG